MPFHRTAAPRAATLRYLTLGCGLLALTACTETGGFDPDFRRFGRGLETASAAEQATNDRPAADGRGVISTQNYQVAVARKGDTIESLAARVGIPAAELSSYNAIPAGMTLREDEIVALPRRVGGGGTAVAAAPISSGTLAGGGINVTALSNAIDRAPGTGAVIGAPAQPAPAAAASTAAPVRHQVVQGETAYTVARLYGVSAKALADWNGLGPDLAVRQGQYLLIPTAAPQPVDPDTPKGTPVTLPGVGTATPEPPSSEKPLPDEKPVTEAEATAAKPPQADLGKQKTEASGTAKLVFPVDGRIIRAYQKKKNDGIDISSAPGTAVKAADGGTVAAITRDTEGVPILVLRHEGGLLTVYANIDAVGVAKGDKVSRGQQIAKVRGSDPAFLHFEVRQGFDSVDPMPFLQ